MLYFDTTLELEGLILYRDYNDPRRYFYMPRAPHLTIEDGQPDFQLLIYRRDITDNPDFHEGDRPGGGFLTMTVDLGVPRATLDAVRADLAARAGGDVDLVPVPFEDGSVRITALGVASSPAPTPAAAGNATPPPPAATSPDAGFRFVENILGSGRPSLYGDNRAVFSIEVTHEGAQLLRASLEDAGASQVAVVYDLTYRGLLPAYEAKITIDFRQSYTYLRSRFNLNTLWFKTDIDSEIEKLRKEGHIKIESADYLQSDPAKLAEQAERLENLAKELATWAFFRPGLTPGKVLADDRGTLTVYDPTEEARRSDAGFTAPLQAAGTGRGSPTDVAGPRNQGDSANPSTTRAGGTPTPPAAPAANAATPPSSPSGSPGGAVEAWNRMGRPQAAFLLKSLSQEEQQTVTFDLRQVAATTRSAAPQGSIRVIGDLAKLPGRIKEVDLNDPFFATVAGTVTSTADFASAGVTSMDVQVRYGTRDDGSAPKDTFEVTLAKPGDSGHFAFFMDSRRSIELEYRVVVSYKAGYALGDDSTQATSPWIRTTTRNLDIDPRSVGVVFPVNLVAGAVDWASIASIQATVAYQGGGAGHERTVVLSQGSATGVVPIRPPAGGSRAFKVHATFFHDAINELTEYEGEGDSTVVLNPPAARAVAVSLSATDPLGRYRRMTVELSYQAAGQPEQTRLVELAGDGATGSWLFFRPDEQAPARYRYRVTLFRKDGSTSISDWTDTIERQLIVGDVFDAILAVEVRVLVSDFPSAGFMGARLRLEYPDALPHTDAVAETFLTGTPAPYTWRVPRRAGGSDEYRYTVQWIRANATIAAVGPVTTADELLLLFPPMGG